MEDILLVFYFKGKTYVGLKIARALLDNHQAWSSGRPMLVVCYTNHALDQFLEGTAQTLVLFDIFHLLFESVGHIKTE